MDITVIAIQNGDSRAFKELYETMKHRVYTYAYRFFRSKELAEEIVQDVFMQIWKYRERIDPEKNIEAYIFQIARNHIYNKLKQIAHHERYVGHVFYHYANSDNGVEDLLNYKELQEIYEEAVRKLPARRQLIFRLSRTEFLSHDEIAEQLCISKNTVKDQIVKSLKFIKHYMHTHAELTMAVLACALFAAGV
ncbi:RNA polymerase sigma-70 factor [Olivibacter ginsenosidimutans]|uniref:RNA polymerase sigma factor n=1 Tax=Olivibacter ginsenosidimutans TaxID=1176537 RepID=A0ABP9BYW1_9SPHI